MNNVTCKGCRWWEDEFVKVHQYGECRRHAPIIKPDKSSLKPKYWRTWPNTHKDDWCGDGQYIVTAQEDV